jgi:hypothetical protein
MKAAPLVAVFDGWGFMLMVSGDLPRVKFGPLWLVYENGTALSVLVVSKTAPCPLLRFEHESAFYRVLMHVAKFLRTLVLCEHDKIVEASGHSKSVPQD